MSTPLHVIAAVAEMLAWLGGFATLVGAVALLVISMLQGPWQPVEAIVEREQWPVLRWFGDEAVGQARVAPHDLVRLGEKHRVTVFARPDRHDTFRWTRVGPAWRPVLFATIGALALWVITTVLSFLPYIG